MILPHTFEIVPLTELNTVATADFKPLNTEIRVEMMVCKVELALEKNPLMLVQICEI